MFEHDRHGHITRHGFTNPMKDIAMYFTRGKKSTPDRPGISGRTGYRTPKKTSN